MLLGVLLRNTVWLILVWVGLDQLSKTVFRLWVPVGHSLKLLSFFSLTHVQNSGAAFGILSEYTYILVLISVVAVIGLLLMRRHFFIQTAWVRWAFIFLVSGIIGNLLDRLIFGVVTDFIELPHWPVFNFADILIDVGVVCLLVDSIRLSKQREQL